MKAVLVKEDGTFFRITLPITEENITNAVPFQNQDQIKGYFENYEVLPGGTVYGLPDIQTIYQSGFEIIL